MKKLFLIFAVAILAVGFTSCDKGDDTPQPKTQTVAVNEYEQMLLGSNNDATWIVYQINNGHNDDVTENENEINTNKYFCKMRFCTDEKGGKWLYITQKLNGEKWGTVNDEGLNWSVDGDFLKVEKGDGHKLEIYEMKHYIEGNKVVYEMEIAYVGAFMNNQPGIDWGRLHLKRVE